LGGSLSARGLASRHDALTEGGMAGCSVLVVDDDPIIRDAVEWLLRDEGYQVTSAPDGMAALQAVGRQLPKILVLDLELPYLDGRAVVQELRRRHIDVAIIVISARHDGRRVARDLAAQRFLPKPFELNALLAAVEQLCHAP
jgi:two-component system response regulator MprA